MQHSLTSLRKLESNYNRYSGQLLQPLLHLLYLNLPIELREKIYDDLIDWGKPFATPQRETPDELQPFPRTFAFEAEVMGPEVSAEIIDLFVRTDPVYFRGLLDGVSIETMLDLCLPSSTSVRNLIRHLRVYVSYDYALWQDYIEADDTICDKSPGEILWESLLPLQTMAYSDRNIKIEICILVMNSTSFSPEISRATYILLESVAPIFNLLKDTGADIVVRLERQSDGIGADVTYILDFMHLGYEV